MRSAHSIYRTQLAALAHDELVVETLNSLAAKHSWLPARRNWSRTYGRFNPDQEPFASLVLEKTKRSEGFRQAQLIIHVDVFTKEPQQTTENEALAFHRGLGWLRAWPFPSDRSIPTIASVLKNGNGPTTIVRYRPGRRCTIRFDENGRSRFAKVYPKKFSRYGRGAQILSLAKEVWNSAERRRLQFAVARPLGWDEATRTFWQEKIDGTPVLDQLFSRSGERLTRNIGHHAASLPCSGLRPTRKFDGAAQMATSIRRCKELSLRVPGMASCLDAMLDKLAQKHALLQSRSLPIHGDLDASQWIYDGHRLGLTDFDDFALGDPELDAATFLAELEFEGGSGDHIKELNHAFLAGYESISGPLNRELLAAYLAHQRIYKALRVARALQPHGDALSESILASASTALMHAN